MKTLRTWQFNLVKSSAELNGLRLGRCPEQEQPLDNWVKNDPRSDFKKQAHFLRAHSFRESFGSLQEETAEATSQFRRNDKDSEDQFHALVEEWRVATFLVSSLTFKLTHPAYYRILALGERVIPLILRELEQAPDHWFVALTALTGEDPTMPKGTFKQSVEAWLKWGRQHNLLSDDAHRTPDRTVIQGQLRK